MKNTDKHQNTDPLAGFFASVILGLMFCAMLADGIVDMLIQIIPNLDALTWEANLSAGLFFGIALADPVGVLMAKSAPRNAMAKLFLGFWLGLLVQIGFLTPFVGGGLSRFAFLFIVTLLVPCFYVVQKIQNVLDERGIVLSDEFSRLAVQYMSLPDRILIVTIMGVSFTFHWLLGIGIAATLITMSVILAITTIYVAFLRRAKKIDLWAEHDPELPPVQDIAWDKFKNIAASFLPGAVLLGAAMNLSVLVLLGLFPDISMHLYAPLEIAKTIAVIGASGLGIILFGMMATLGFGLATMLLIGRFARWRESRLHESCVRLIKVMCFRPINQR